MLEHVHEQASRGVGLSVLVVEIELCGAECEGVVLLEKETLAAIQSEVQVGFLCLEDSETGMEGCESDGNIFVRKVRR